MGAHGPAARKSEHGLIHIGIAEGQALGNTACFGFDPVAVVNDEGRLGLMVVIGFQVSPGSL